MESRKVFFVAHLYAGIPNFETNSCLQWFFRRVFCTFSDSIHVWYIYVHWSYKSILHVGKYMDEVCKMGAYHLSPLIGAPYLHLQLTSDGTVVSCMALGSSRQLVRLPGCFQPALLEAVVFWKKAEDFQIAKIPVFFSSPKKVYLPPGWNDITIFNRKRAIDSSGRVSSQRAV